MRRGPVGAGRAGRGGRGLGGAGRARGRVVRQRGREAWLTVALVHLKHRQRRSYFNFSCFTSHEIFREVKVSGLGMEREVLHPSIQWDGLVLRQVLTGTGWYSFGTHRDGLVPRRRRPRRKLLHSLHVGRGTRGRAQRRLDGVLIVVVLVLVRVGGVGVLAPRAGRRRLLGLLAEVVVQRQVAVTGNTSTGSFSDVATVRLNVSRPH